MKLFEPLEIGSMRIPNRIMVPAMVTRLSGEDGFVNQAISDRYAGYAAGGVGLVVIEAMAIHHAKSGPLLRISEDKYVPGLADMVKRVHDTSTIVPSRQRMIVGTRSVTSPSPRKNGTRRRTSFKRSLSLPGFGL